MKNQHDWKLMFENPEIKQQLFERTSSRGLKSLKVEVEEANFSMKEILKVLVNSKRYRNIYDVRAGIHYCLERIGDCILLCYGKGEKFSSFIA